MAMTNYFRNKLIEHALGKTSYTMPTVYVGLSSTTPVVAGTGATEPSTGSYARVATSGATWGTASAGASANASAITFPVATADWVSGADLTHILLYDAATSGNLLWFDDLTTPKPCTSGDQLSFPASSVTASIT